VTIDRRGLHVAGSDVSGGSSFWMKTPDSIDARDLALAVRQRGVLLEPGHFFFDDPEDGAHYYRIAYSSIESAKISAGIDIIADTIAEF